MEKEIKKMNMEKSEPTGSSEYKTLEDAFNDGYNQGMLAGYTRAISNVMNTATRLQDKFFEVMKGGANEL